MIARIFVTDPEHRITIEQIREHPWSKMHRPETLSCNVCPPHIQQKLPPYITRNNTRYSVTQRPNLFNQKIIEDLVAKHEFNKESLLQSIRNNKHNHLTATYYLLLKKHMVRRLKDYVDAFMELKPYVEEQPLTITD